MSLDLESTLADLAPGLLRFTLGLLGDPAAAEEASQEALAALVLRWRRHGPPDNPAAFAFAIARRRAWRERRKRQLLAPLTALFGHFTAEPRPDVRAEARSELGATLAALGRLRGGDREALLLVAAGERNGGEAASLLGISPAALKMRLHRARRRLAKELAGGGHGKP